MTATTDAPIRIPRADLLASVQAILGVIFLLSVGWGILIEGSTLSLGYSLISGLFWFGGAGYTYRNPDAYTRGSDPASRLWLALAGAFICIMVAGAVLVLML